MRLNSNILKDAIALTATLSDTIDIMETETGWSINTISIDHTTMALVTVPYTAFAEQYEYNAEEPKRWVMDCSKLLKAVKVAGSDDVELKFVGGICKVIGGGMTSRVSLMTPPEDNRRFPPLEPDSMIIISASDLARIIKAQSDNSNTLRINIAPEGVDLSIMNDENVADTTLEIPADGLGACEGTAKAYYSLPALTKFIGAVPKAAVLTVSLSTDYPVIVSYATEEHLEAKWLAAPWITDEE